jgi:hypothetical protein
LPSPITVRRLYPRGRGCVAKRSLAQRSGVGHRYDYRSAGSEHARGQAHGPFPSKRSEPRSSSAGRDESDRILHHLRRPARSSTGNGHRSWGPAWGHSYQPATRNRLRSAQVRRYGVSGRGSGFWFLRPQNDIVLAIRPQDSYNRQCSVTGAVPARKVDVGDRGSFSVPG